MDKTNVGAAIACAVLAAASIGTFCWAGAGYFKGPATPPPVDANAISRPSEKTPLALQEARDPANISQLLKEMLDRRPGSANERWTLGPSIDVSNKRVTGVEIADVPIPERPGELMRSHEPTYAIETITNRTRIVSMYTFRKTIHEQDAADVRLAVDPQECLGSWRDHMAGIIEEAPGLAEQALKLAKVNQQSTYDREGVGAAVGDRYWVRALVARDRVTIDLLWTDPENPEAVAAWNKYQEKHK